MIPAGSAPIADSEAEQRAVEVIKRYGQEGLGAVEVRDVQSDNLGWDLEFHFANRSWWRVEVKGNLGYGPFIITPNEWSAAQRFSDYILYQVVGIASPATARIRCFRALGAHLTQSQVKSMSWMVTGWSELHPEEILLTDSSAARE
jgi:hypothetical protein